MAHLRQYYIIIGQWAVALGCSSRRISCLLCCPTWLLLAGAVHGAPLARCVCVRAGGVCACLPAGAGMLCVSTSQCYDVPGGGKVELMSCSTPVIIRWRVGSGLPWPGLGVPHPVLLSTHACLCHRHWSSPATHTTHGKWPWLAMAGLVWLVVLEACCAARCGDDNNDTADGVLPGN